MYAVAMEAMNLVAILEFILNYKIMHNDRKVRVPNLNST